MNGDLISRSALIRRFEREIESFKYDAPVMAAMVLARDITRRTLAVDAVEVVHGYNAKPKYYGDDMFECSVCGYEDWDCMTCDPKHHNYCPNCGAKMDGGEEDAAD